MRRSLARCVTVLTSASVGRRSRSRSVSSTHGGLASCNVGGGMSCSIVELLASKIRNKKEEAGFPSPLFRARFGSAGSTGPADQSGVHRLFGRSFGDRKYRHESAAVAFGAKLDTAFDLGEQGMIGAHADIKAGMPGGAALTRNDVARDHEFATVRLDSEALACRITTVTR